jgi:hypothetical protein
LVFFHAFSIDSSFAINVMPVEKKKTTPMKTTPPSTTRYKKLRTCLVETVVPLWFLYLFLWLELSTVFNVLSFSQQQSNTQYNTQSNTKIGTTQNLTSFACNASTLVAYRPNSTTNTSFAAKTMTNNTRTNIVDMIEMEDTNHHHEMPLCIVVAATIVVAVPRNGHVGPPFTFGNLLLTVPIALTIFSSTTLAIGPAPAPELSADMCTFSNMLSINGQGILGTKAACLFAHDCPKTAAVLQIERPGIAMKMIGNRWNKGCAYGSVHFFGTVAEPYFSICRTKTMLLGPFVVAMCSDSNSRPDEFVLSIAGQRECDNFKTKANVYCVEGLRNVLDEDQCSNMYGLLETLVRHKNNMMDHDHRLVAIALTTEALGLDNLNRVLEYDDVDGGAPDAPAAAGGQMPQGAGGANQNNANAGAGAAGAGVPAGAPPGRRGGDRTDIAVFPTVVPNQTPCTIEFEDFDVQINAAEMFTAAQKSMQKCKTEHRMNNRDCRYRVATPTSPFMTRDDWRAVFPVNVWVFTKSSECDEIQLFLVCIVLTHFLTFSHLFSQESTLVTSDSVTPTTPHKRSTHV